METQPFAVNLPRLESILTQEMDVFRELAPHSTTRHKRLAYAGLFVEWAAVFVPEAFSGQSLADIDALIHDTRRLKTFDHEQWDLLAPFDAAKYALSNKADHLDMILANLAHGKSFRRRNVQNALACVAMFIPCDLPALTASIVVNAERGHGAHTCAALLAVARGTRDTKLTTLSAVVERLGPRIEESVQALARGSSVVNPFYGFMQEVVLAALHRLCLLPTVVGSKPPPDDPSYWTAFNERQGVDAADMLWRRLMSHPLLANCVLATHNLQPWPSERKSIE